MIVLHGDAVLALLRDEADAGEVAALIRSGEPTRLSALGLAELIDHLVRELGTDEDEVLLDLAQLDLLPPLPIDADGAVRAGLLRARHHRKDRPLSLVDCVTIESARANRAILASASASVIEVAEAEGLEVRRLSGRRRQRSNSVTTTGSAYPNDEDGAAKKTRESAESSLK